MELRETRVSWQEDTVLLVMLTRPIPLIQILSQLPEVASVTEEPHTTGSETTSRALKGPERWATRVGYTIPKRLRLVLKQE